MELEPRKKVREQRGQHCRDDRDQKTDYCEAEVYLIVGLACGFVIGDHLVSLFELFLG